MSESYSRQSLILCRTSTRIAISTIWCYLCHLDTISHLQARTSLCGSWGVTRLFVSLVQVTPTTLPRCFHHKYEILSWAYSTARADFAIVRYSLILVLSR